MNKKQLFLMLNELQWLLESGIDLLTALNLLGKQASLKSSRHFIHYFITQVQQGRTLSQAMQQHGNAVVTTFIRCGEASGELSKSLEYLCEWQQSIQRFYKSLKASLFYPGFVFSSAIVLLLFMLFFIVPQFEALYAQFQAPLPASTQWLLQFASSRPPLLPLAIGGFLAFTAALLAWQYSYAVRYLLELYVLRLPIIGTAMRFYQHAKFCRLLHLLLAAGLPLLDAMQLLRQAATSLPLQQALAQSQQSILQGTSLHRSLAQTKYFEGYLCDLVALAEHAGKLEPVLNQLANYYNERLEDVLNRCKQLLQPVMILFLGLLLGIWILLLYYPLLQLGYAI
jgi:type IV pilus assembly protein PilC